MSMVGFPLLLIPLAVVNIIAFLMPGVSLGSQLYTLPLLSGATWTITFADVLIAFGMLLLFFEVAKTARPGGKYLTDHLLSILLCGAAIAEFLLLPQFGNSTFFLLTFLTFIDVICGIAIRARQRGFVEVRPGTSRRAVQRVEPSVAPTPVPAAPVQGAAPVDLPVGEAVLDPYAADAVALGEAAREHKPVTTAPDGSEVVPDRPPEPQR